MRFETHEIFWLCITLATLLSIGLFLMYTLNLDFVWGDASVLIGPWIALALMIGAFFSHRRLKKQGKGSSLIRVTLLTIVALFTAIEVFYALMIIILVSLGAFVPPV